jgi:PAS domain S-box-containing protein
MNYDNMSKPQIIAELKKLKMDMSHNINLEWEQIFDSLPDLITIIDTNHRILKINKAMSERLNLNDDDLLGRSCFELIHGTTEPPNFCPNRKIREDMKSHSGEFHIKRLNGDFLVSVSPIFNKDGKFTSTIHVAQDITAKKNMENVNGLLASIVESSDDAIIGKDLDGNVTSWNRAAQKMFGYSEGEIKGKNLSILLQSNLSDELDHEMVKIKLGQSIKQFDTIMVKKNGELIDVSLYISPIYDPEGNMTGISIIAHDTSERKKIEGELKDSEERYRELFNNANDMITVNTIGENGLPGNFIDVNDVGINRLGYSRREFLNMTPADIVPNNKHSEMPKNALKLSENGHIEFEIIHQTKDGKLIPVEINNHLFELNGNKVALAISRDISRRKKVENALKKSEMKYRTIFENVQDMFYQTDNKGIITEISPSVERYSGYKPSELIGRSVETLYSNPDDRQLLLKKIEENGEAVDYEIKLKTKEDNVLYVSCNVHFLYDSSKNVIGVEGSLRDVTERKNIEIQLKDSLFEKEMLLKEIHHRVKNNLMIISSLLNLQSSYIKDKESQEIFKESQNRAKSMALIHERLYQSTDLKRIDFGDYIESLSSELFHTYTTQNSIIELKINVEDIFLDINTAIPLGLIVNELITNSLKHAFPNGRNGEIDVNFHKKDDNYEFILMDNGVGFPDTIDYKNTESLGMQIITNLTEQIDGKIELDNENGTTFKISFKETII